MSELAVGSLKGLAANDFVIDVAAGSTLNVPPPAILQVLQTVKTDTFSTTSNSPVDVPGLAVTITPSSASSKILILADVIFSGNGGIRPLLRLARDSTEINLSTTSAGPEATKSAIMDNFNDRNVGPSAIHFLDTPATTSATVYKIRLSSSSSLTAVINRTGQNNSVGNVSSITVMEVAG